MKFDVRPPLLLWYVTRTADRVRSSGWLVGGTGDASGKGFKIEKSCAALCLATKLGRLVTTRENKTNAQLGGDAEQIRGLLPVPERHN